MVLSELEPRRLTAAVLRPAAVLVPVLRRPQGPTFLLIRRHHDLQEHAGQVAFPGGRLHEGESVEAGALREAGEEVDLPAASVEIVGRLDDQPSPSRYRVAPVVGLVRDPPPLVAEPGEVTEMFEVPLACLLQPGRAHAEWWPVSRLPAGAPVDVLMDPRAGYGEVDRRGMRYKVYFFDTQGGPERVIWGLTARIVSQILVLAFDFTLPEPEPRER
ncbi:MAG: CoA pyrophosphatase [Acidobacteria bacterium]|nr:CoA pyrophosphatase [Acidobacteriota bacterium]